MKRASDFARELRLLWLFDRALWLLGQTIIGGAILGLLAVIFWRK